MSNEKQVAEFENSLRQMDLGDSPTSAMQIMFVTGQRNCDCKKSILPTRTGNRFWKLTTAGSTAACVAMAALLIVSTNLTDTATVAVESDAVAVLLVAPESPIEQQAFTDSSQSNKFQFQTQSWRSAQTQRSRIWLDNQVDLTEELGSRSVTVLDLYREAVQ